MNEISEPVNGENLNLKSADACPQDVVPQNGAQLPSQPEDVPKLVEPKKRKTRRGKSKRKAPYQKYGRKSCKMMKPRIVKPEAPHNDNQFLLEDHGGFEELDERLKSIDRASTSIITRTRESSFSVDSDGEEFYSSPDDEGEFLMQDFNDQYQCIQTEQLHTMSQQELIVEYLALDSRTSQKIRDLEEHVHRLENELENQNKEKDIIQRENEQLKLKLAEAQTQRVKSDSEDSETDSSDSCSSSTSVSSSSSNRSRSPILVGDNVDFAHTNGHTSPPASVDAV